MTDAPAVRVVTGTAGGATPLASELRRVAWEWAETLAPGGVAAAPGFAGAAHAHFTHRHGPLVVVWPELPVWRPELVAAVLGDLRAGCALVLGPRFDGGAYLVGLAEPLEPLLALGEGAGSMQESLAVAAQSQLEVGLLRTERGLRSEGDVRAALADPCLPEAMRRRLRAS